ncbi:lysophospholipid acyltransferase family protein [Maribellus sediminis]|uniref:lysophospholipid acyltransferase family protein n=1 Tax=Maribellus sediminis TaxID=2696285 RepID=UPI001431A0B2|nr:lysophospholipid acyltransferase family protein [Maribellus sediminis]
MKLIRTILFFPLAFIRLILLLAITAYITIVGILWLKLFGFSRKLQNWMERNWGRAIMFILGVILNKYQLPQSTNFILMPNHRSYIDIFIVTGLVPSAMIAKAEVAKWPFVNMGVRGTGSILVDRKNTSSLLQTMSKIKSSVSQGIPVTLFPEGTTFKGPLTKHFKNGSFKIAADTQIPVIPMAIEFKDKDDAWVDDDTFIGHFFRQLGKPVTRVNVRFGEPISSNDYQELQKQVKEKIDAMLEEIQEF